MRTREYVPLDFDEFPDFGMPKVTWLAARQHGIGSSDVAALLGLDRFNSPMSVYLDKVGERAPVEENDAMHFGKRLEIIVAQEFGDRHEGLRVLYPHAMFQHADYDFALASPDRLLAPLDVTADICAGWEGKTGRNSARWEDGPPREYVLQVTHQLEVCGLDDGWLSVLLGGNTYQEFEIKRDPILAEMLMEREQAFWELVEARTPPAVDGHEATTEALRRLYNAASPGRTIELTAEQVEWIERSKETKHRLELAQERDDEARNQLRAALGDAEYGTYNGETVVSWKQSTGGKGRVNLKRLEADHPDLVAEYREATSSRRLLVP